MGSIHNFPTLKQNYDMAHVKCHVIITVQISGVFIRECFGSDPPRIFSHRQVFLSALQDGVSLKQLPRSHRVLGIPGVRRASMLDADIPSLSIYLADVGRGSLELLKLSTSRTKTTLTPAGTILRLKVQTPNPPYSC